MKKAIAMRCTQEQFDAVKPKLETKVFHIYNMTNFKKDCYLVNNYGGDLGHIINLECPIRHVRELFEEWNEKVFLEACGISVIPDFEEVLKYFENAETVKCASDGDIYYLDFNQRISICENITGDNKIYLHDQIDIPFSGLPSECYLWTQQKGFAEIIKLKDRSKKERPNRLDELEKRISVLENKVDLKKIADMPENPLLKKTF